MAELQKGIISTIEGPTDSNGNYTRARIEPEQAQGIVTRPLVIPFLLRGDSGKLEKGTEVVFVLFPDQTGLVVDRADGEWFGQIYGAVTVTGKITTTDVKTSTLTSVNGHKHGGVEPGSGTTGGATN